MGEPQIYELFKTTMPTRFYWVTFPIIDLKQANDTVKRVITIEKNLIDKSQVKHQHLHL